MVRVFYHLLNVLCVALRLRLPGWATINVLTKVRKVALVAL